MSEKEAYVTLDKVSKIYGTKEVKIIAVDEISFEIAKGEFVVIVGPSGAGKTTVLNILGGMDKATSGDVLVDGKNIARYNNKQLTGYRRNDIGFVFQFYNLVPNLTGGWSERQTDKLSGAAFWWRAAASFHSQGTGEESETFVM